MTKETESEQRLSLPQVTLCAVTSVNVAATIQALETSMAQIGFAACKLLTDVSIQSCPTSIEVLPVPRLKSSAEYSSFLLSKMVDHIATSHCLVIQWDGHVLDSKRWRTTFLDYDYIGASWPQFDDGHDVGNGGFSLRSRRLMEACRALPFKSDQAEDIAIGRTNRKWLENNGMRFAPKALADAFSTERAGDLNASFGYHGVFNMPRAIGLDKFWGIYQTLDEHSTVRHDFLPLLKAVRRGPDGWSRALRMIADHLKPKQQPEKPV